MRLLAGSVREGRVPVSIIDRSVERMLRLKFQMRIFDDLFVN